MGAAVTCPPREDRIMATWANRKDAKGTLPSQPDIRSIHDAMTRRYLPSGDQSPLATGATAVLVLALATAALRANNVIPIVNSTDTASAPLVIVSA